MRAGLFPGQGVPAATTLEAMPERDPFVERAQMSLGYPLRRRVAISARRKNAALPTELAQPAIFVASLRKFEEAADGSYDFFAGHSLGEYAALVAAESLSFEDALRVVRVRGEAMHEASKEKHGSMAAIMGFDLERVNDIAKRAGVVVANDNAPDQVVVAGAEDALAEAAGIVTSEGGRSVLLEVSGAFHTVDMGGAAAKLAEVLDDVDIKAPSVPVVSNVTARPYEGPAQIRELLVDQLTSKVRWRESIAYLWEAGVESFEDFGPGRVVGPLAQRTVRVLEKEVAGV